MSVGLVMIVKDEYDTLPRCLASVRGVVNEALICDTGSSDLPRLKALCAEVLPGIRWFSDPWVNFAHNRTLAVERAREGWAKSDYLLTIDADETLDYSPAVGLGKLGDLDLYNIDLLYGPLRYARASVFRRSLRWRYTCPVHEVLTLDSVYTSGRIESAVVRVGQGGARSAAPDKYRRDAEVLKAHLVSHPGDRRAQYYYAQSLRDAGSLLEAISAYEQRASMGGWGEEVFSALLERAKLFERTQGTDPVSFSRVLDAYLKAHAARPTRAEALWHAMRFARARGCGAVADVLAPRWREIPRPEDVLFLEPGCYFA